MSKPGVDLSQTLRPFVPPMEDGNDLKPVATQPVWDHVRCARYDQFPRTGDPTRTAHIGQFGEPLDSFEQCATDSIRSLRIVLRDVRAEISQMFDRARRPDDGHTRGAFRSRLRPHERTQFATSLCGTPRPSSSWLMPV